MPGSAAVDVVIWKWCPFATHVEMDDRALDRLRAPWVCHDVQHRVLTRLCRAGPEHCFSSVALDVVPAQAYVPAGTIAPSESALGVDTSGHDGLRSP